MRSLVRETVFQYIFSKLFNPSDEGLFDVLMKNNKFGESDYKFANDLLNAVNCGEQKYIKEIDRLSIGFKINRIYNADKCALMIGMAELDAFPETPYPVVIDEAVKLVAKYSTEKSTDFVNGILASYCKEKQNG